MTLKNILIFVFIFNSVITFSQNKISLKHLLLENINPCYSNLLEAYDDEKDVNIFDGKNNIDDSVNGYISVSGEYPTCGCYCSNIAGGYKQSDGDYTILVNEEWSCSTKSIFRSNRKLKDVFPKGFGIKDFIPEQLINDSSINKQIFKLNVEIPRKGTDTKVSLELIPFGINQKSENILTYKYEEDFTSSKYIYGIKSIIENLNDKNTIDFLINDNIDDINKADLEIIQKEIDLETSFKFKNINEISEELKNLKYIYKLYESIQYEYLILGWDKSKNQFYVKKKIDALNKMSFIDFVINSTFWRGPSC